MVFKLTFSLEILMKYTCMKLYSKDHCIFKGVTKKQIYFLFGRIYVTHTWIKSYITERGFKNYLHLKNSTWNLLL
jgi:hypothetical protein